jgi:Mn-containing catalase
VYYHDPRLQYPVRVERPNPLFARMLQQAVGGVEGEIRVCLQYFFQAWGARGPAKYRDMLLHTATEEISHIEMLSTAIALNLEGAPVDMQEEGARKSPMVAAIMGGQSAKHFLSAGLAAMPVDSDGVPFDCSHIYSNGNMVANMYANVTAEATGRVLATRLYEMTDDPGMKDMLAFLIARDTMHQNQWLAAIEDMGGNPLPVPNSFPQTKEVRDFSYAFMATRTSPSQPPDARWVSGPSMDGRGEFHFIPFMEPLGQEPTLSTGPTEAHAQKQENSAIRSTLKDMVER